MKQLILTVIATFLLGIFSIGASAQTFSNMPEKQRNAALIKIARVFYKNPKFKAYYKEYGDHGIPRVSTMKVDRKAPGYDLYTMNHDVGELQYVVSFWLKSKRHTAAMVLISDKLGQAFSITFADNTIVRIWDDYT